MPLLHDARIHETNKIDSQLTDNIASAPFTVLVLPYPKSEVGEIKSGTIDHQYHQEHDRRNGRGDNGALILIYISSPRSSNEELPNNKAIVKKVPLYIFL